MKTIRDIIGCASLFALLWMGLMAAAAFGG